MHTDLLQLLLHEAHWKIDVFDVMVLILDGNSEHVAHAWTRLGLYGEKKSDL